MTVAKNSIKIAVEDEENPKKTKATAKTKKTVKKRVVKKRISPKATAKPTAKTSPKKTTTKKKPVKKTADTNAKLKSAIENALEKKKAVVDAISHDNDDALDIPIRAKSNLQEELVGEEKKESKIAVVDEDKDDKAKENNEQSASADVSPVRDYIAASRQEEGVDDEVKEILKDKINTKRHVKLYRNIAYFFIFMVIALAAAVFYYSFVKATITIIPNQERISSNMIFDVYDKEKHPDGNANSVSGLVEQIAIEDSKEYKASGEEVIGKEVVGKAVIYNNYTKNQPLVASTRLLTPDGKLFRTKSTVNVPAGSSAEVEIYADEASPEMAIGPSKFTIPGLWAGLQDKIYAESKEKIEYKQKVKYHIVNSDIENAIRDSKQQLLVKAKSDINETYKNYSQIIYKIDENSISNEVDKKVGDEAESFTVSIKADVVVVAFNEVTAADLAEQKFTDALPDNKDLVNFDKENIIYSLNNYNEKEGTATVNATFEGKVSLKENSNIVDIDKILGLNEDQLNAYLSEQPEIAGYEVKFYPSFLRRVPKLVDRVEIKIKK